MSAGYRDYLSYVFENNWFEASTSFHIFLVSGGGPFLQEINYKH